MKSPFRSTSNAGIAPATPTIRVRQHRRCGAGQARVVLDVAHTSISRSNPEEVARAFYDKFNGRLAVVPGSFRSISSSPVAEVLTGVVAVARDVIAVGANTKGFRCLSSNMFVDDESNIWTLQPSKAGDLMVRSTGIEDDLELAQMMRAHCGAANVGTADMQRISSYSSSVTSAIQGGSLVTYVGANSSVKFGIVLASDDEAGAAIVLPYGEDEEEVVDFDAVVDAQDAEAGLELTPEEEVQESISSARGVDINYLKEFYKKVYARGAEFYKEFEKRVNAHAFM